MTSAGATAIEDFTGFYHAQFQEVVALVYSFTRDLGDAQDLTQEAFARAWRRWAVLSRYEDPGSWVRKVAVNLARSRWRRLRAAAVYLARQREAHSPALNPDHVAVVDALRALPPTQREAMVLHYLADLPVEVIAHQLEVPLGTVKSWLHRGRAGMAAQLAEVSTSAVPAPAERVMAGAMRRQRTARATVAVALVISLLSAFALWQMFRPRSGMPPVAPSPTAPVDPADPMLSVDWLTATIDFGATESSCGSGVRTFQDGQGQAISPSPERWSHSLRLNTPVIGDLTGDGRAEAVVQIHCIVGFADIPPTTSVIERLSDGRLRVLASTPPAPDLADGDTGRHSIKNGTLWVVMSHAGDPRTESLQGFRWDGMSMQPVVEGRSRTTG